MNTIDLAPQVYPDCPMALKLYRNMGKNEKMNFIKDNPDYFRTGNEGSDYLDICDRIMCENTRNLVYLLEERDAGKGSVEILSTIKNYFGKPTYYTLAPRKYWDELKMIKEL